MTPDYRRLPLVDALARAALRELRLASGPLTVEQIRHRVGRVAGGVIMLTPVYNALLDLERLALVESMGDDLDANPCRIFYPTRPKETT
jgi:hypothetical protein